MEDTIKAIDPEQNADADDLIVLQCCRGINLTLNRNDHKLHLTAVDGDLGALQQIISTMPNCITNETTDGALPLHFAALRGHTEVCDFLFHLDPATLHKKTHFGLTAADIAETAGHTQLAEILRFAESHADDIHIDNPVPAASPQTLPSVPQNYPIPAKYISPFKQGVHIPTQLLGLAEPSQDSLAGGLASHVDVSQLLLDEFQRASLLEEEGELAAPRPGHVQYEKYPRTAPTSAAAARAATTRAPQQTSLMFNLSDDGAAGQATRPAGTAAGRGRPAGSTPADALQALSLAGQQLHTAHGPRSPFLFNNNAKPVSRLDALRSPTSRPGTSPVPAMLRAVTAGSSKRPAAPSPRNNAESENRPAVGTAPQLQRTVQVVQEVSVPALVITSAAVLRASPSAKHRAVKICSQPPTAQAPTTVVSDVVENSNDEVPPGTVQSPIYTLHKAARPTSPRSRGKAQSANNSLSPRTRPASTIKQATPASPNTPDLLYVKYALDTRKLEPTRSPTSPPQPAEPTATAVPVTEKTIVARKYVPVVNVGTVPDTTSDLYSQVSPAQLAGFVPSRPLRPGKSPSSMAPSPAHRLHLDLDLMARQAVRISEDPDFVPLPRPLDAKGAVQPKEAAGSAQTRAQRLDKVKDPDAQSPRPKSATATLQVHIIPAAHRGTAEEDA